MKKKKWIRFSKRLLILLLCTSIVSGTYFNRQKMTVQATSIVATLSAYTLYEICMYIGGLIIGCAGIGSLVYLVENRDDVARVGKDFIDSCDLDELSDWVISKADSLGQSYVFGSEALQTVKDTTFEVIQGGGSSPENNEDNDGDGDKDFDDRTKELEQLGMWGTATFTNWFAERMEDLLNKDDAGEETFLDEYVSETDFSGFKRDVNGNYLFSGKEITYANANVNGLSPGDVQESKTLINYNASNEAYYENPLVLYCKNVSGGIKFYYFAEVVNYSLQPAKFYYNSIAYKKGSTVSYEYASYDFVLKGSDSNFKYDFNFSIPVFESYSEALIAAQSGDYSAALNYAEHYRIADWLQEDWQGVIESLNTGIRSLSGNMLIVGQALNQAMTNQLNGLGYISAIAEGIAGSVPLSLPAGMAAPLYYPDPSLYPALDPSLYPWAQPNTSPEPEPGADSDSGNVDDDLDPKDEFGLNMIFGILILLIMIIIMLLIIFISCLAFIVMVFRIEATTGFLPDDMVAGLDYLRTLEIPGFGMSVYSFFMALIYILLFFSIVGILRKNIDKIKFPRKGGKK